MKNSLLILIIVALSIVGISFISFGKEWPLIVFAKLFKINSLSFTEEQYKNTRFRLCKPGNITEDTNIKYPLVVYLHGAGERGNDNSKQIRGLDILGNGFSNQAKSFQPQHPSFIYVPQCQSKSFWSSKQTLTVLIDTIQYLVEKYPIDTNRLYLIGYSMGGSGSYSLASQ